MLIITGIITITEDAIENNIFIFTSGKEVEKFASIRNLPNLLLIVRILLKSQLNQLMMIFPMRAVDRNVLTVKCEVDSCITNKRRKKNDVDDAGWMIGKMKKKKSC